MAEIVKGLRVETETVRKCTVRLNASRIREAFNLPIDAEVTFRVPGGADWSGLDVGVDDENPVTVSWEERERREH